MTTFTPSVIHLRPATWSDHARMAAVCSASFDGDDLFGTRMHPHRTQYPSDFDLYWRRMNYLSWFEPRIHLVVATVPHPDNTSPSDLSRSPSKRKKDLIVGFAEWERMGPDFRPARWNPLRPLLRGVMRVWVGVTSWLWPNRAADPGKMSLFEESWPFIAHFWTGERARCWDLHVLAVHPDFEGRGVGRKLVRWGLERAEREGVSASVKMAPGVEGFYEKCGFDSGVVGWCGMGGKENPMSEIDGGNIFFWDPKKIEKEGKA